MLFNSNLRIIFALSIKTKTTNMNYPKGLSSLDRDQTIRDAANRNTEQQEVTNPAKEFVKKVNGLFPGTFPTDEEMNLDHIELDINTFDKEDLAA